MRISRRGVGIGLFALALLALAATVRPATVGPLLGRIATSPWFPLVLLSLYSVRPVLGWPVTAISALVGFRFGVLVGVPIALLGAAYTSLVPYAAGRLVPDSDGLLSRLTAGSDAYFRQMGGFRGLVAARLAPLPAEPVSAAAGAGGVSLPAFVLGTVAGELPWTIAAVSVGHSMTVFAVEDVTVDWWLVGIGLAGAIVLLAGPVYRTIGRRR
ncbi:TVP38/TMEM64 family protein [Halanaeroarchaeum sp. HSR-CO]|uniref:TVP38/TMEM64 family protein n=1 Tax=Halanaeroarchaeum sp. HSR-CO TaxID=2866382 RepID=UPI00217EC11F|nr:VTT domain-containing protein [Halanaeroarchaeum sp. HSR-CO]